MHYFVVLHQFSNVYNDYQPLLLCTIINKKIETDEGMLKPKATCIPCN